MTHMLSCSVSFRDDKKLVIFSVKCNSQQYRPLRNARTNFFEPDWSPFLSSARLPIPVHPKKSTYINRLFTSKGSLFLVCPLSTVNNEQFFFFFSHLPINLYTRYHVNHSIHAFIFTSFDFYKRSF